MMTRFVFVDIFMSFTPTPGEAFSVVVSSSEEAGLFFFFALDGKMNGCGAPPKIGRRPVPALQRVYTNKTMEEY
eukprot:12935129-Prorocentrum_lima.AAC.1